VLLITGLAKVISIFGGVNALKTFDPVFGLRFIILLPIVGVVEIIVASLCLFLSKLKTRLLIVAWLATLILIYRGAMVALHYKEPCGCLGSMTAALHISPQIADQIMKITLAYLIIGSYGSLIWLWREHRKTPLLVASQ